MGEVRDSTSMFFYFIVFRNFIKQKKNHSIHIKKMTLKLFKIFAKKNDLLPLATV